MKTHLMLVVALAFVTSTAHAAAGEWLGTLQGGVHIPNGDYSNAAKTGWVGGVGLDYAINEMFSLGANLDYNGTKAKDDVVQALNALPGVSGAELNTSIFNYGVHGNLFFTPTGVFRPYLMGTAGAYSVRNELKGNGIPNDTSTETKFGFGGGVGVMMRPVGSALAYGIEGSIHDIPDAFRTIDPNTGDEGARKAATFFDVVAKVSFSFSDMGQTGTTTTTTTTTRH